VPPPLGTAPGRSARPTSRRPGRAGNPPRRADHRSARSYAHRRGHLPERAALGQAPARRGRAHRDRPDPAECDGPPCRGTSATTPRPARSRRCRRANSAYPQRLGTGKRTDVIISSSRRAHQRAEEQLGGPIPAASGRTRHGGHRAAGHRHHRRSADGQRRPGCRPGCPGTDGRVPDPPAGLASSGCSTWTARALCLVNAPNSTDPVSSVISASRGCGSRHQQRGASHPQREHGTRLCRRRPRILASSPAPTRAASAATASSPRRPAGTRTAPASRSVPLEAGRALLLAARRPSRSPRWPSTPRRRRTAPCPRAGPSSGSKTW